jgi:hypothetical protein
MTTKTRIAFQLSIAVALLGACGDDDPAGAEQRSPGSPEETASACASAAECFEGVEVVGKALCLDRVRGGHCTHTCETDEDCCAVEGECDSGLEQVCSPFESASETMCFLSCEADRIEADREDFENDGEYCQRRVSPDFICRSSGGGSNNRKICVPGDCGLGASCVGDGDCDPDFSCLRGYDGGYCGIEGCASSDDCPADSACIVTKEGALCAKRCSVHSDCSFCRYDDFVACSDDATFADDADATRVCLPR